MVAAVQRTDLELPAGARDAGRREDVMLLLAARPQAWQNAAPVASGVSHPAQIRGWSEAPQLAQNLPAAGAEQAGHEASSLEAFVMAYNLILGGRVIPKCA